ncbi:hypothetical protein [Saccharibacillus kuerlensis]|uniref:hypothetical protein n=1 Tax=Saccharibacillus kuerlensis TaxID=459527 RepID=UPI00036EBAC3|nr:hypothetical protein [Saccharibacillus kuerlensis]
MNFWIRIFAQLGNDEENVAASNSRLPNTFGRRLFLRGEQQREMRLRVEMGRNLAAPLTQAAALGGFQDVAASPRDRSVLAWRKPLYLNIFREKSVS